MSDYPNDAVAMPAWKQKLKEQGEILLKQQRENSVLRGHRVLEHEFRCMGVDVHFIDEIVNPTVGK